MYLPIKENPNKTLQLKQLKRYFFISWKLDWNGYGYYEKNIKHEILFVFDYFNFPW
jgi:hypothetical protein